MEADGAPGYPSTRSPTTTYIRRLSQKFTTACSAQNLAAPVLLEINAQWPPWLGAINRIAGFFSAPEARIDE